MEGTNRFEREVRFGLWALPLWAGLLFVGTLSHQPDYRTDFTDYARYIVTDRFLWGHLVASIAGAGIGMIGAVALAIVLAERSTSRLPGGAVVAFILGNTFIASVFGAAAFAQPAIGRAFLAGEQNAVALNDDVYGAALFGTAGLGILLFSAGTILFGVAVARSGSLPPRAGVAMAVFGPLFTLGNIALPGIVQSVASLGLLACGVLLAVAARRERVEAAVAAR